MEEYYKVYLPCMHCDGKKFANRKEAAEFARRHKDAIMTRCTEEDVDVIMEKPTNDYGDR